MAGSDQTTLAAASALARSLAARVEALCAVPSPTGSEEAICDSVESWARGRFGSVRRIQNSLVVFIDGERPTPNTIATAILDTTAQTSSARASVAERPLVALCGHLDTVPIPDADRGKRPVWTEGRLEATGASDMKSGLAVMMELGERIARADRFCDLVLVFYSREEGPYLENELGNLLREESRLLQTSLAVFVEPTDNTLQLGCAGSIHAAMTFEGRSAHSARPWQGVNAIHRAGPLLAELGLRTPREALSGGLSFREVISVTGIEGGRARNVVPDRCALNVNFRFAPDKSLEAAGEELCQLGQRFGAFVQINDRAPACSTFADHPLVARLRERAQVRIEPKQAWTDVARMAQVGVPAVNFGPGATAQAHQQGEWVELNALEQNYQMLEAFLRH